MFQVALILVAQNKRTLNLKVYLLQATHNGNCDFTSLETKIADFFVEDL